jgi:simple sugar transport system substrate-binding protein
MSRREEELKTDMNRRSALKTLALASAAGVLGVPAFAQASAPQMVTVAKIIGVPWFNLLSAGIAAGGTKFHIDTSMIGPAHPDPAVQVGLVQDLIARKVGVIGLVPLDVKVLGPVLKQAQDAGIIIITQEGPDQENRTWDVEMVSSKAYGEAQMKALAAEMGGEGQYIILVGTLTTPLHNAWADAAIAYQKANYPKMQLATSRFPGSDEVDASEQVVRGAIQAYPDLRGVIGFGSSGPIGAGNVVRQRHLQKKVAVVGTAIPSQVQSLIMDGAVRKAFLWSPKDAGYAMVAVADLALRKRPIKTGIEIAGLGKATVDEVNRTVSLDRLVVVDRASVAGLAAQGL